MLRLPSATYVEEMSLGVGSSFSEASYQCYFISLLASYPISFTNNWNILISFNVGSIN